MSTNIFIASCVMQFVLGAIHAGGVITRTTGLSSWVAPVRMFTIYVLSIFIYRMRFFVTARTELIAGAALFSLGDFLCAALTELKFPGSDVAYSLLGGVGGGLSLAAVGRLTASVYQGKKVRNFRRANFLIFPIFIYCTGGYLFSQIFEKFPGPATLAASGAVTFTTFLIVSFFWLPKSFAVTPVPIPANFDASAEFPGLTVIAVAAHVAVFFTKQPAFSLLLNGLGRYASGIFAELFGFRLAACVAGAAVAAAIASENGEMLSIALGACVVLIGRCPQSQVASIVYGSSFAIATFFTSPWLKEFADASRSLHIVGAVMMAAALIAYFRRK